MNQDLDLFINESLHRILGMSDKMIFEYIRTAAKNAKSLNDFKEDLAANIDFPLDARNEPFFQKVFSGLNEKTVKGVSAYELEEQRKAEQRAKASEYKLIDSSEIKSKASEQLNDNGKRPASKTPEDEPNLLKKQKIGENSEDFLKRKRRKWMKISRKGMKWIKGLKIKISKNERKSSRTHKLPRSR